MPKNCLGCLDVDVLLTYIDCFDSEISVLLERGDTNIPTFYQFYEQCQKLYEDEKEVRGTYDKLDFLNALLCNYGFPPRYL